VALRPLLRWVPPAYTPIPASSLSQAARDLVLRRDPRQDLEALLTERFEAARVVLTDSGTSALQLAIGLTTSREVPGRSGVALPAFACFDLVTAVLGAGFDPVFYDVAPETLEPDWTSFESAIGNVRVVVVAPLFGLPAGIDRARALSAEVGVHLIEDAAQSIGSSPGGRHWGTLGDSTILSFGRGKGWTGGGGGALLLRDGDHAAEPRLAAPPASGRMLAASAAQWLLGHPSRFGVPARLPGLHLGETRYHPPTPTRRMAPGSASLILSTRPAAEAEADQRRQRARGMIGGIMGDADRWSAEAGYLRLPVLMPSGQEAEAFAHEYRRLGVARSYPTPLPRLEVLAETPQRTGRHPGAERLAARLVTLPTHSLAKDAELEHVVGAARQAGGRVVGPAPA